MEEIILYLCRRDPIDHKTTKDESGECPSCHRPLVATLFQEVGEVSERELADNAMRADGYETSMQTRASLGV